MKELYQTLYEYFDSVAELSSLSHFSATCGHTYHLLPNKLMVVGRATNDWESLDCSTAKNFGTIAQQRLEQIGFDWILQTDKGFRTDDDYISEALNIPVVIASHPEHKNESEYAEVILQSWL